MGERKENKGGSTMEQLYIDRMNSAGQGIGRAADGRTAFVEGAPPAFILSQDRTLRPKYSGLRARPVLTTVTLIGSVRFIWF